MRWTTWPRLCRWATADSVASGAAGLRQRERPWCGKPLLPAVLTQLLLLPAERCNCCGLPLRLQYLREEGSTSTIGLWGRSMGAVTALLYSQRDPSIAGMVGALVLQRLCRLTRAQRGGSCAQDSRRGNRMGLLCGQTRAVRLNRSCTPGTPIR